MSETILYNYILMYFASPQILRRIRGVLQYSLVEDSSVFLPFMRRRQLLQDQFHGEHSAFLLQNVNLGKCTMFLHLP